MPSLLNGINTALQALLAHQQSIQVTEHNVANANTPGYHRQEAIMAAQHPITAPGWSSGVGPGQMGTGVAVDHIRRFNVAFLDSRFRRESGEAARWNVNQQVLQHAEAALAETSTDGLQFKLNDFWANWQALSTEPANTVLRTELHEQANTVSDAFNRRAIELGRLREDQDLSIIDRVGEVNAVADQVAALNAQIAHVRSVGHAPNDLLDERDRLLDRLGELSGAVAHEQQNGEIMVSINGHALVVGTQSFDLETAPDAFNANLVAINWNDGQSFSPPSGELAGLLEARDSTIVDQINGLDSLAAALINRVNTLHQSGYGLNNNTGMDFFSGSDAMSLRVSSDVDNPASIATAAAADSPGDSSIAQQIAEVQHELLMNGGTATLGQYYNQQAASLGLNVQQAGQLAADRQLVADSMRFQRESVTGVSLDEEAAKLVQSQKAYQAAVRMMTAIDEMLDQVINRMGIVGR
ncbi:MAG: flagellar hook-associated protein FlgK [Chloroflexi bacterium]|nr:MAG: flagellar hook-associated protein FlgK [Chloroflexota bacterium]MBL1194828.1 flagellar hook-associated protein FlgK [Chloroflexota bacterium]NOH12119.1 flagellar hook-associated protein FlgK [Chloroflexota bacterium]